MKYKVGDKVRIKSLDWYYDNRDRIDEVECGNTNFIPDMVKYCEGIVTISAVLPTLEVYHIKEDGGMFNWTDDMIEGMMNISKLGTASNPVEPKSNANCLTRERIDELAVKIDEELPSGEQNIWTLPKGYIFKDENGNVINATKIVLEKTNTLKIQSDNMETETHRGYYTTEPETTSEGKKVAWFTFWDNDFADKVELDLSNRELIQEDGKWFVVKKKKEYPKTYEECCKVLSLGEDGRLYTKGYKASLIQNFQKLLICRDAYWKIAGEEMGLGKPWEPDWCDYTTKYCVIYSPQYGAICKRQYDGIKHILAFPTEEMRDAFKENFDPDIEICKELL